MISKEDQAVIQKLRTGKWITLAGDIFGSLLLFYLYSVNNNDVFLLMAIFLLVVGGVFVAIMGRAEKKYIEKVKENA